MLVEGRAIGQKIGAGAVRVMTSSTRCTSSPPGEVLVADMTDPDWEPIMKRASAIVTNRGGRTCHAAIIARELGIPAVVGTRSGTKDLADGREVTVSCAEGDTGMVYDGLLDFDVERTELDSMPDIPVKIMMNVGTPEQAFAFSRLPHRGVGLARLEFIINRQIGIHPKALLELEPTPTRCRPTCASEVEELIAAYPGPREFFVQRVAEGISMIAAAFAPEPVIVRMSDFKSNEYANLVGGTRYEPDEENPMIGYRGASRYLSEDFADCFEMECAALQHVRDDMGLTNVKVMIPFVRTVAEAKGVIDLLGQHGLVRGENDLQVVMMCEVPSNAVIPEQFLEHFDGFSIGSNDLTQLTLGVDRDSASWPAPSTSATRRSRCCSSGRSRPAATWTSTSASAARAPPTTPTSPSGCSSRASSRCRSTPTPSSTPGCGWAGSPSDRRGESTGQRMATSWSRSSVGSPSSATAVT